MKLSTDQQLALKKIIHWLAKVQRQPAYLTLGGYAGTGKTTLVSVLRNFLKQKNHHLKVAFVSFTGKGARVIESTLRKTKARYPQDFVGTIHSLIYAPIVNQNGAIIGWNKKRKLDYQLIIIDESSMVDHQLWANVLSFAIPTIAVGDHGQLPPIEGQFNLMENPFIKLENIHRQAKNHPIIKLSIEARTKGKIKPGVYGLKVIKIDKQNQDAQEKIESLLSNFNNQTLVMCGYNSTRVKLNNYIRQIKFFEPQTEPQPTDRVICLNNNPSHGLFNGMLGTIISLESHNTDTYFVQIALDDEEQPYQGQIYKHQFGSLVKKNYTQAEKQITQNCDLFDFGYVITVHKAQGSQAKKVILFEERFIQMNDLDWQKWLYTGITRAQEELYLIG